MDWNAWLSSLGVVPAAAPIASIESNLLAATGGRYSCIAAGNLQTLSGPVEIQIHRVLAGRYGGENFVAIAIVPCAAVRGTATVRPTQPRALRHFLASVAPWEAVLMRIALVLLSPFWVPSFLFFVGLFTLTKRLRGKGDHTGAVTPRLRGYVAEGTSEVEVVSALPAALVQGIVELDPGGRIELSPGRIVVERLLRSTALLAPFVQSIVPELVRRVA